MFVPLLCGASVGFLKQQTPQQIISLYYPHTLSLPTIFFFDSQGRDDKQELLGQVLAKCPPPTFIRYSGLPPLFSRGNVLTILVWLVEPVPLEKTCYSSLVPAVCFFASPGAIPGSFDGMKLLEEFDCRFNRLSGAVPEALL